MKKNISLLIFGLLSIPLFAQQFQPCSGGAEPVGDEIFLCTPNGHRVIGHLINDEMNEEYMTNIRNYYKYWAGNCMTEIGEPTFAYNCHSYAWNMTEGGPTCWVGYESTEEEDVYWADGSYVEVANESEATKVSWVSCDHSAITTGEPGTFISKWCEGPLYIHTSGCYYDGEIKYYKRATPPPPPIQCSISGPYYVCSTAAFSLNNCPSGLYVTWQVSSNLEIVSGQGTKDLTVQKISNGYGHVKAIVSGCNINPFYVYVGTPIADMYLPEVQKICVNENYDFSVMVNVAPYYYCTWEVYPSSGAEIVSQYTYDNYDIATLRFYYEGSYWIFATVGNVCGTSEPVQASIWADDCWWWEYSLSPNPASEIVTISKQKSSSTGSNAKKADSKDENTIYSIRIVDFNGGLQYSTEASGENFTLPVKNLKDGKYIIQINNGKKTSNLHLVVKH